MDKKSTEAKKPHRWTIMITVITFVLSFFMSYVSEKITGSLNVGFGLLVLFIIIFTGIIFDTVGIAVASADEMPFHALASKKVKGAKAAIFLLRNAEKVSSVCNDVIGDIAGIISGSVGAIVSAYIISVSASIYEFIISVVITAAIASLTVGGKAFGKTIGINNANAIIMRCAKILAFFGICERK